MAGGSTAVGMETEEMSRLVTVLEHWLDWLDSEDGLQVRKQRNQEGNDSDLICTIPDPPGKAIVTVGDLRTLVTKFSEQRTENANLRDINETLERIVANSLEPEVVRLRESLTDWEKVGNAIMLCAVGREAPLSDSDVCGELIRLRQELADEKKSLKFIMMVIMDACCEVDTPDGDGRFIWTAENVQRLARAWVKWEAEHA